MNAYLISVAKVKELSFLDSNIDDKTIKIALLSAQEQLLEPAIGTQLYNKLLAGVANGSLDVSYQNLIVQYIWKVLVHGTCYMVARNLLFRYTNSSIVQDSNQNSSAIAKTDLEVLRSEEEIAYKHHMNKLQLYLQANGSTFPEYYQAGATDLPANPTQQAQNFYYEGPEVEYLGPSSR